MSITFEYSFNSDLDLPDLASALNRLLGTTFAPGDPDVFSCELLGVPFVLARNDAENDQGINFRDYRYQLWNKTWDGSPLRSIQLETLVLAAYVMSTTLGIGDAILSYDMQRLLARYSLRGGSWWDDLSDRPVEPLEHIVELQRRLDVTG